MLKQSLCYLLNSFSALLKDLIKKPKHKHSVLVMFSMILPMLKYFWLYGCVQLNNCFSGGGEITARWQQLAQKPCELAWTYRK